MRKILLLLVLVACHQPQPKPKSEPHSCPNCQIGNEAYGDGDGAPAAEDQEQE